MANRFNNQQTPNIGTVLTSVYATDSVTVSTVIGINMANKTDNTVYADIVMQGADTTQTFLVKGVVIPKGQSLAAMGGDQKLVMIENNVLLVKSSAASSVDVIVSILEIV